MPASSHQQRILTAVLAVGLVALALWQGGLWVLLVLLRKPLADWFWDEPQIEQLLAEGDRALAAGRLSAADGSGGGIDWARGRGYV